jgi:hypothetical protein
MIENSVPRCMSRNLFAPPPGTGAVSIWDQGIMVSVELP